MRQIDSQLNAVETSQWFVQGRRAKLSEEEMLWANVAWKYMNNNYNPATGLINATDKYQVSTMWDAADTISATHAAFQLGLIDTKLFDERISTLLGFINNMAMFKDRLPNRYYETTSGKMIDYQKRAMETGWSAVDIGRLLVWLKILQIEYPHLSEYVDKAVLRWNFCDLLDRCGTLYSGTLVGNDVRLIEEGRLGYEEYAALGYQVWGFDTTLASTVEPYGRVSIFGQEILYDLRDPRETGTLAPILMGPYLYSGLEFNWDQVDDKSSLDSQHTNRLFASLARKIYKTQEERYRNHRILTARTDHQSSKPPYFVYDSIFSGGYPWNTVSDKGQHIPELAMVATRAVFGMWALWTTDYTNTLLTSIQHLYTADRGWYEGRYEKSGAYDRTITLATNTMVLEALLYKATGKLYNHPNEPTYMEALLENIFKHPNRCFPPEREQCDL